MVKDLYPSFIDLKKKLEEEKAKGSENDSASFFSHAQELTTMDHQMAEEISRMKSTLQEQIGRVGKELAQLQIIENDNTTQEEASSDLVTREWVGVIKEYESSLARLTGLKALQK